MDAVAPFPGDCLPPEQEYQSREDLFDAINDWAASRGYAFITGRSTSEKSGKLTVTYMCDRSCRPPISPQNRQRKTTTRGTGCQFSVLAKQSRDKSGWTLRHRLDAKFSVHNHEPSSYKSAHPTHRKLTEEDQLTLARLSNNGVAPKHIKTYLRQYCNSNATQQDIYNCVAATRRRLCQGQNTIHALANELDKEGFWSRMQFDADGRVTAVLFAHPDSLKYLQAYPDVLLLDCTYKTNKYGMPLLDMIGVDACQRSFCIAFAFLSGETDDDYAWALDRLRSLYDHHCDRLPSVVLTDRCLACMNAVQISFPTSFSLLCLWHANKAVLRYCLPAFATRELNADSDSVTEKTMEAWEEFYRFWHQLMRSPSETAFNERLLSFEKRYVPGHRNEVGYVKTTWLEPYKKKLVKAWVDQHYHFGNTATSRVEGIHALLKSHLQKSTLDLFEAWRAMKQALMNQLSELKSNQARQQMRTPIELSGPLYGVVRGWVSHEALRKVEEQRRLMDNKDPPPSPICTKMFNKSYGLPCVHDLIDLQSRNGVLLLEHFHSHWHLQREGEPQILLEPRRRFEARGEGVSDSRIPPQSTRREPSAFEQVHKPSRAPSKCTRCGEGGHTRASRACPLRFEELLPSTGPMVAEESQVLEVTATILATTPIGAQQIGQTELGNGDIQPPTRAARSAEPASPLETSMCPPTRAPEMSQSAEAAAQKYPYDSPQAIYSRYVASRHAWYMAQPAGSIRTNQQYRRAMGLPLRYDKFSYDWCLDYKQMTSSCSTDTGTRSWTKEEMMAYLDWSTREDERVEEQVLKELRTDAMGSRRRGMGDIWKKAAEDSEAQEAMHHKATIEDFIVVEA